MKYFSVFIITLFPSLLFSQEINTYFQQKVNYNINVKLDDINHELSGFETIEYTNNSKKPLNFIYFHLWPNAYKKHNTALGKQQLEDHNTLLYYAPERIKGFIDSLDFKSDNKKLTWNFDTDNEDICIVSLPSPLKNGETITISTPFHIKLPKGIFSRMGHINQSYQITQWFPKPAVYDKDGWHQMPYLDQGEFYSEFGTFDVYITLPKNYVVGATGDLVGGEKELEWLNKKAATTKSKIESGEIIYINKAGLSLMNFPISSDTNKTLHYHQENIHDFAWFADKRYHVLKGEVELPHSKRKVTTWAMFTNNEGNLWENSIEYLNDATYYYSLWNGDYPYNHVTAVDGVLSAGGGMEYPNITVIGESGNDFGLETVIMHEVGHNWFYGVLGSNERDHGWMDEGLNSMNENRYIETKYLSRKLLGDSSSIPKIADWLDLKKYKHKSSYYYGYLLNAKRNKDQAIEEHSAEYTSLNYGTIVYGKAAIFFDYLKAYLGDDLYDQCMQKYFDKWKFKHPQPEDLREIFETETNKNLSWFFDDIIKTTKKIDYKITSSKKDIDNPNKIYLEIKNKGKIDGPFSVSGIKDEKIISTQWYESIDKKKHISFPTGNYDKYRIDAQLDIPEINRKNNTLKTKGLFKTIEPLRLQILGSLENPDKTQFFFSPIVGFNMNDKGMIGMAFYNSTIPSKKFEYVLAPLYAPSSENINGYTGAFYHIHPNSIFQEIRIGSSAASFSYLIFNTSQNSKGKEILEYYKVTPSAKFTFKKKRERQHSTTYFSIENINVFEEKANFSNRIYTVDIEKFYINRFKFGIENSHPINPFDITTEIQQADNFVKLNFTTNYHIAYRKNKTGFDIRLFSGSFLYNKGISINGNYNYQLSGNSDYLYDEIYLARTPTAATNGFLTQQFAITDGGFKNKAIAESNDRFITGDSWLAAINLKSNLLTKHLSTYADFGIVGSKNNGTSDIAYNFGIALNIVPNIFEIYFPIKSSSEFNLLSYGEKIRFTLNLNTLNPFKKVRELDL